MIVMRLGSNTSISVRVKAYLQETGLLMGFAAIMFFLVIDPFLLPVVSEEAGSPLYEPRDVMPGQAVMLTRVYDERRACEGYSTQAWYQSTPSAGKWEQWKQIGKPISFDQVLTPGLQAVEISLTIPPDVAHCSKIQQRFTWTHTCWFVPIVEPMESLNFNVLGPCQG